MDSPPNWLLNIVGAVEDYEDKHGHPTDGWDCLRAALLPVPENVRAMARGYAQAKREVEGDRV